MAPHCGACSYRGALAIGVPTQTQNNPLWVLRGRRRSRDSKCTMRRGWASSLAVAAAVCPALYRLAREAGWSGARPGSCPATDGPVLFHGESFSLTLRDARLGEGALGTPSRAGRGGVGHECWIRPDSPERLAQRARRRWGAPTRRCRTSGCGGRG